jgi:hypothetical protein
VTGSFSIPASDGSGFRAMVMARGSIGRHISWWLRYGITCYDHKKTIGSGPEEIRGNTRSEVKIQITGSL